MRLTFLIVSLLLNLAVAVGQITPVPANLYGIKDPGNDPSKFCSQCTKVMESLPPEVSMGFLVDENKDLCFAFSDDIYFNKLFALPYDGLAVDIMTRNQFPCNAENKYSGSWLYKGYLMKPLFLADIKKNKIVDKDGYVLLKIGKLPKEFNNKEIEFNLILLKNRYVCWYNTFYNLPSQHFGLLDMGMYIDTLTEESLKEKSNILGKRLKIEVPFAKDKYEYAIKDIKPLYDSLNLTNYDILSITIKAFSSVEGTTERNLELQKKRAESIIKALQTLQAVKMDSVKKTIIPSENWVEFYEDIIEGRFSSLRDLSKVEIKQKLNSDKAFTASMESILKKHRKAIILLELVPKSAYKDKDAEGLKAAFDQSIANKNINEALALQKEIFQRILYNKVPESFLEKLEVPEQVEYGLVNNSLAAYKYQENVFDLFETLKQFKKLEDLLPNNQRIRYNICVLELKGWLSSELTIDPQELYNRIQSLYQLNIDKRLIKRLLINYHIINSEILMGQRKYVEKDKSLKFIYDNYVFLNLSDNDILSLAQYFTQFGHTDWAKKFLYQYVKKAGATEDLVFYYLNLTIAQQEETEAKEYRSIMLNAVNSNKERYCNLFSSSRETGGITFQLLENEYLKKTFCENCK